MTFKLTCSALAIYFFSCTGAPEKTKPVTEDITESVYASGIIKAKNQYEVFTTVTGVINKVLVAENDLVNVGTPLAVISNEASKIARENALLSANFSRVSSNREKLTDVQNSIVLEHSKYISDSAMYKRQEALWNQNIGSRFELEQKELAYKNSKTAYESSKLKYSDLLKQLRFNAEQSNNNLAISKNNERDFTVKSEINGKVYALYREPGELVNPQVALGLVGESDSFLLELQVDEYDIAKIRVGQQLMVSMNSYKGKVFEARIAKIFPLMNEHTKSFSVEAKFVTQPPLLYPNLTAEANIIIQAKSKAMTIPRNYLINDSFVLVGKNQKKAVTTGLKDYQKVEILRGLTPQEIIYKPQ